MGRAPCCDKANVKKGPWSPEEDATLKAYIDKYGTGGNWIALPQKIGLKRCGKSCRLRWLNYLRPNIKHGGFTEEEDNIICSLYISIGSRWSIIASMLPGRTDNDIKNYWNTRLKKKLFGRRKQGNMNRFAFTTQGPTRDVSNYNLEDLSSSAIERLQLHMQLQNPFSIYNNPLLWPKSSPLHQKMIQAVNSLNENQHILIQSTSNDTVPLQQDFCGDGELKTELGYSNNGFLESSEDNLLVSSTTFLPTSDQMAEFDCFKAIDGSRDMIGWWSNNELDRNSATSSSSWDSENVAHQYEGLYQDYTTEYCTF